MYVTLRPYRPIGPHIEQTLSDVYVPTIPDGVDGIVIQAVTANIRYTLDGTAPDSNTGFQQATTSEPRLVPVVVGSTVLKFINESSGSVLQAQFVRQV